MDLIDEARSSRTPPWSPQNAFPKDYEEEVARILEIFGTVFEEGNQFEHSQGQDCSLNLSASAISSGYTEILSSSGEMEHLEVQGEQIPSVYEYLELEIHEERDPELENQSGDTIPI